MNRYILFVLIPFAVLSSAIIVQCIQKHRAVVILLPLIFVAGVYCMDGKEIIPVGSSLTNIQQKFQYDENMSYVKYLDGQQNVMNIVLENISETDIIYANFPISVALMDTRYGFTTLTPLYDFKLVNGKSAWEELNYALISDPGSYDYQLPDSNRIFLQQVLENEVINVKIYKRK